MDMQYDHRFNLITCSSMTMTALKGAWQDFTEALGAHRLWFYMANNDIRLRYRGSTLGPLWITLTMMIFIGALGVVFSRLFKQEISTYIPYLTTGILVWNYISTVINDSTETFLSSKEYIEGMKMSYFIYIFRMINRNLLIFFHNFIVYVLVVICFHVPINLYVFLAIPGLLLLTAILAGMSVLLSLLGTRFRDLPPIITAITTVVFFVSPINWQARLIGENSLIVRLNPISYFLDLVRAPLLGSPPSLTSVWVCLILLILSWVLALWAFSFFSKKIPFWL
jgi:lipopolysaccharide transport system permease protein